MKNTTLATKTMFYSISILLFVSTQAHALDQIVRPFQSVRSSAMGGVRITTGLYDENFFGNAARATANPKFRFTLVDPTVEVNSSAISRVGDFTSSGDPMQKFGDAMGDNHHVRIQTSMPAIYFPPGKDGKLAFAFGLISNTQADLDLRRSFRVSPQGVTDIGPAFTVARRFMDGDRLSVGLTTHLVYRISTTSDRSMAELLNNSSFATKDYGRDGSMIDFDLGSTYRMPWGFKGFTYHSAITINNVLGGKYSNMSIHPLNTGALPAQQPRTFGLGLSASKEVLWKFTNFVLALEFTDIGNNPNGSLFRTVHLGSEARYGVSLPRLGINQGYLTGGLGLDLRFLTLEYAYSTEEMALNVGVFPDHRHTVKIALQI